MTPTYVQVAEQGWRWVLDQVRYDAQGPWIPEWVTAEPPVAAPDWRYGFHSGTGGLAHALAEVRRLRPWTHQETALAGAIADQVRDAIETDTEVSYFDGLVSHLGTLLVLGEPGGERAVARMTDLATAGGWVSTALEHPKYDEGAVVNDLTLGTAGVLHGALEARAAGLDGADRLADLAVAVLLAEVQETEHGVTWPFVPLRFRSTPSTEMPNLSHGTAGVAHALARAGLELDRPELVDLAVRGAEHLVSIGTIVGDTLVVPRYLPHGDSDEDPVAHGWCHGGTGTQVLFRTLGRAGVDEVAGDHPDTWRRRLLEGVRRSGLPARVRPGSWDNDGRCCGSAGVGEAFLDAWLDEGDPDDLAFARTIADALVQRAVVEDGRAWWQFVEHRKDPALQPPGVGWMQGATGIAAYLFRLSRLTP